MLFSDKKYRKHMYFVSTDWPGGLYASPSMPGSRPGGLIAVCWAALVAMGKEGYMNTAREIFECSKKILSELNKIPDIKVLGNPPAMVLAFAAEGFNIFAVSDAMHRKGWSLNALHRPNSVHLCVTKKTVGKEQKFIDDLKECIDEVKNNMDLAKEGNAPMYGMASSFPDRSAVKDIVYNYLDILLETKEDY